MNILATSSGMARRAAGPARVAIPAAAAITVITLTGCAPQSPAAAGASAAPAAAIVSKSASAVTRSPASAPPTTPPSAAPPATSSAPAASPPATTSSSPPAQPGALTASIAILGPAPGLVPGGQPVRFRVTITNNSSQAYSNILPLVSLGHCSCTASTLFPKGTLQERDSTSNVWPAIPYDVEGFGTDYLSVTEPGGIQMISPGGTATFEYRVALSPATSAQVTRGTGALDVTLIRLPGHSPVGPAPSASAPVDVQSGAPPA
jgi:hypothetical protein